MLTCEMVAGVDLQRSRERFGRDRQRVSLTVKFALAGMCYM